MAANYACKNLTSLSRWLVQTCYLIKPTFPQPTNRPKLLWLFCLLWFVSFISSIKLLEPSENVVAEIIVSKTLSCTSAFLDVVKGSSFKFSAINRSS